MTTYQTLVEKKTSFQYIKFTFTGDNKIRVKVPIDSDDDVADYWLNIAIKIRESLPNKLEKTFRGKIRKEEPKILTLFSDSKKESISIHLDEFLNEL